MLTARGNVKGSNVESVSMSWRHHGLDYRLYNHVCHEDQYFNRFHAVRFHSMHYSAAKSATDHTTLDTASIKNVLPTWKRQPFHDDVIKWKHFPRYWPFVRGIHRSPVNSPHRGEWREALMFSLICVWINGWEHNREAGDLRRYRAHYDVIVMYPCFVIILLGSMLHTPIYNPARHPKALLTHISLVYRDWNIMFSTSRARQYGHHFLDIIFKFISFNENVLISLWISLKFFHLTISQHWLRWWLGAGQARSHYVNQWWPCSLTHMCVTRPQLVLNWYWKEFSTMLIDFFLVPQSHSVCGGLIRAVIAYKMYLRFILTHWGRYKMAYIVQTTFSNAFSGI